MNSTKASKQVKADAKGIADTIRGFNAKKPKPKDGETETEWVSKSQQSFVQKAEHFGTLVALLKSIPEYAPTEDALTTAKLGEYYKKLKDANDGLGNILTEVFTARTNRNRALYSELTGMVNIAKNVKDYVKGAFKAKSAEYQSIAGLKFTKVKDGGI